MLINNFKLNPQMINLKMLINILEVGRNVFNDLIKNFDEFRMFVSGMATVLGSTWILLD